MNKKKFIIFGNALDYEKLIKLLKNDGFIEMNNNSDVKKVDILWSDLTDSKEYSKKSYEIISEIKNRLPKTKQLISNKLLLYERMNTLYPQITDRHMAKSINISKLKDIRIGDVYILKPTDGWSGKNIIIVKNNNELNQAKKKFANKEVIASKYIQKPLLFGGKKFHLRIHFALIPRGIIDNRAHYSIFNVGRIMTAALKYKNDDFSNTKIHDTHAKTTDGNIYWPDDYTEIDKKTKELINSQINLVIEHIVFSVDSLDLYPESKKGFEIFGTDFMIDFDNEIPVAKLLECNEKPGYVLDIYRDKKFKYFCNEFFIWIYNDIIKPLLNNSTPGYQNLRFNRKIYNNFIKNTNFKKPKYIFLPLNKLTSIEIKKILLMSKNKLFLNEDIIDYSLYENSKNIFNNNIFGCKMIFDSNEILIGYCQILELNEGNKYFSYGIYHKYLCYNYKKKMIFNFLKNYWKQNPKENYLYILTNKKRFYNAKKIKTSENNLFLYGNINTFKIEK